MFVVGLTGGIGSGKSTVAELLEQRGAVIVDADVAARTVMATRGAVYAQVVRRFPEVVQPDGAVDRRALAAVVFADPAARTELEGLTHPAIRAAMAAEVAGHAATDAIVLMVIPLLVESGQPPAPLQATVVVDCPPEVAMVRLVARGLTEQQAQARMAAQAPRERRLAAADFVIDNSGTPDQLADEVARCWWWLDARIDESVA